MKKDRFELPSSHQGTNHLAKLGKQFGQGLTGWQLGLGVLGHRLMGLHDKLKGGGDFTQPGLDGTKTWQSIKKGVNFYDR